MIKAKDKVKIVDEQLLKLIPNLKGQEFIVKAVKNTEPTLVLENEYCKCEVMDDQVELVKAVKKSSSKDTITISKDEFMAVCAKVIDPDYLSKDKKEKIDPTTMMMLGLTGSLLFAKLTVELFDNGNQEK